MSLFNTSSYSSYPSQSYPPSEGGQGPFSAKVKQEASRDGMQAFASLDLESMLAQSAQRKEEKPPVQRRGVLPSIGLLLFRLLSLPFWLLGVLIRLAFQHLPVPRSMKVKTDKNLPPSAAVRGFLSRSFLPLLQKRAGPLLKQAREKAEKSYDNGHWVVTNLEKEMQQQVAEKVPRVKQTFVPFLTKIGMRCLFVKNKKKQSE